MPSELTIQQALFGYDTGHHLLGASLPLSTDHKHMLAVITDLSGSAPTQGFDATYTGLPLSGTNYYAFFCTWLAPEMPRPGCVWSHVLFLELADFAEMQDLSIIRQLFRRPITWSTRTPISGASQISGPTLKAPKKVDASMLFEAAALLRALYMHPQKSVVLPSLDTGKIEDLILALWSQQWPRLRRNFRFSTGFFCRPGSSWRKVRLAGDPRRQSRGLAAPGGTPLRGQNPGPHLFHT